MKNILLILTLPLLAANTWAFDSSWIEENVHEGCTFMESKAFMYRSENWSIDATPYGTAIGATNGLLDSEEKTPNGLKFNVSYYNCPAECSKNGASKDNGMLGKENLLNLIGYEPIQCNESLVVSQLLRIDFDGDGFMGYAIRYKTTQGGFQGSGGHLFWGVDFIKNSNGKLSILELEDEEVRSAWGYETYYKNIRANESVLTIEYLIASMNVDVNDIEKTFLADGDVLVLSE